MKAQAEDAAAILRKLVREPCLVAAHSAGTVVAMELARRYPELISQVFLMEPPSMAVLPQDDEFKGYLNTLFSLVEQQKYTRALNRFLMQMVGQSERRGDPSKEELARAAANSDVFIRNELRLFYEYQPDYEALRKTKFAIGVSEFNAGTAVDTMARGLARSLDCRVIRCPGRHNLPQDLPLEFAIMLTGLFSITK